MSEHSGAGRHSRRLEKVSKRTALVAVLSAMILTGLAGTLPTTDHAAAGDVEVGAPFVLTDQYGKRRTDKDFRGQYMLIYFGFTFCPDTCPTALLKMTNALAKLDESKADRVAPLFITIDPERDTPEVLKDYAAHFGPRMVALTGDPKALSKLAYAYGVYFKKAPGGDAETYLMDHTSYTYLMAPDGRYITHFESDVTVEELASAMRKHIDVAASQ